MKTDQAMIVQLEDDIALSIFHKSEMGNLTDLWQDVSRRYRARTPDMYNWLTSERSRQFINKTAKLLGKSPDEVVQVKGRGRTSCTWAHLNVIIFALEYISPEINAVVIHEFVHNRILQWRDDSGDRFIEMNAMLKLKADTALGRPAEKRDYIRVANTLKARVQPDSGDWNLASAGQLAERSRIEGALVLFLKNELVRDWEHLKELAKTV